MNDDLFKSTDDVQLLLSGLNGWIRGGITSLKVWRERSQRLLGSIRDRAYSPLDAHFTHLVIFAYCEHWEF